MDVVNPFGFACLGDVAGHALAQRHGQLFEFVELGVGGFEKYQIGAGVVDQGNRGDAGIQQFTGGAQGVSQDRIEVQRGV